MIRTLGLLAERLFRELTDKAVRRGSFNSAEESIDKIHIFINYHHNGRKVYVWTAKAEDMPAKTERTGAGLSGAKQIVRERYHRSKGCPQKAGAARQPNLTVNTL
ncbi:MAG: hypothetical protein LBP22_15895 [Deltaproteobacteria bacterium]|jgi:hypothetical protein|nr:hypothetical protein [Deltaproteobacteria bacterium]